MADRKRTIKISAVDDFSGTMTKYNAAMGQAEQATSRFAQTAGRGGGFGAGVRNAAQDVFYMGNAAMMAMQGVNALVGRMDALAQAGFNAERSELALQKIAGGAREAQAYIDALGRATLGTVTDAEAAAQAYQLIRFGLADSAAEAEEFVRTVAIISASNPALGGTAEAISQIQLTLSNMSFMRLDQLGISSGVVRARMAELKDEIAGISTEEAFQTAVMEQLDEQARMLGDDMLKVGNNAAQVKTRLAELKTDAGKIIGDGFEWAADKILDTANYLGIIITHFEKIKLFRNPALPPATATMPPSTASGILPPRTPGFSAMIPGMAGMILSPEELAASGGMGSSWWYGSEGIAEANRYWSEYYGSMQSSRMAYYERQAAERRAAEEARAQELAGLTGPLTMSMAQRFYSFAPGGDPFKALTTAQIEQLRQNAYGLDASSLPFWIGQYGKGGGPQSAEMRAFLDLLMGRWQDMQPAGQSAAWYAAQGAINMGGLDEARGAATYGFLQDFIKFPGRKDGAVVDFVEVERGLREALVNSAVTAGPQIGDLLSREVTTAGGLLGQVLAESVRGVKFGSLAEMFGFDQSSFDADVIGGVEQALQDAGAAQEDVNQAVELYNHLTGAANAQSTLYNNQLAWLAELFATGKIDAAQFNTELMKISSADFSGLNWLTTSFQMQGPTGWDAYADILNTLNTMDFTQIESLINLPNTVQDVAGRAADAAGNLMSNLFGMGGEGGGKGGGSGLLGGLSRYADTAEASMQDATARWLATIMDWRIDAAAEMAGFESDALASLDSVDAKLAEMAERTISVQIDFQVPASINLPINLPTASVDAYSVGEAIGGGGTGSAGGKGGRNPKGRAGGGVLLGGEFAEVNEPFGTQPETFMSGGRQFLLAPKGGYVAPHVPGGAEPQPVHLTTQVVLDGRVIAEVVSKHTRDSSGGRMAVTRG